MTDDTTPPDDFDAALQEVADHLPDEVRQMTERELTDAAERAKQDRRREKRGRKT
jgi:hypothetical protein